MCDLGGPTNKVLYISKICKIKCKSNYTLDKHNYDWDIDYKGARPQKYFHG